MEQRKRYKYYENTELTDIHSAGRSIVQIGNQNIYVDFGIPGDIITLEVEKRQKGKFSIGSIAILEKPSTSRCTTFCQHFGICGGCNWQHFKYDAQLHWKQQILLKAFEKYDIKTPEIPSVIASPQLHFFRNKVDYTFFTDSNGKIYLGYHPINEPYTNFAVNECFLQPEPSRTICKALQSFVNQNNYSAYNFNTKQGTLRNLTIRTTTTGDCMVILGLAEENHKIANEILSFLQIEIPQITSLYYTIYTNTDKGFADGDWFHVAGKKKMHEKMDTLLFQISAQSFYQPNPLQAIELYKKIRKFAALTMNDFAYDLYTGAGTIACFLANDAGKIMGIEGSAQAIADAKINAQTNGFKNLKFLTGDILKTFTPDFVTKHGMPDVIILDPPRSGTLIEIKKTMLWAKPRKIVYVSCNPVSLAWDLKQLCEEYTVEAIQPFDMFPHTHHVETVVLLCRK